MIDPQLIIDTLTAGLEAPHVEVFDTTGTSDHFIIYARSASFEGKTTMQRHRLVNELLKPYVASGALHAAQLKLETP
jgi:stress-induced morphogen